MRQRQRVVRYIYRVVDLITASCGAGVAVILYCFVTALQRPPRSRRPGRRLLVLDAAYSMQALRDRGLTHSVMSRDLGGFFDRVWSVHPLVGADDESAESGQPTFHELGPQHVMVEGHVSWPALRRFPLVGLLLAQLALFRELDRIATQVHVVRVGDPYYQGLIGLLLCRRHRIPLAVRVNGNYDAIFRAVGRPAYPRLLRYRWIEKRIERVVLARADLVAGANEDNRRYAIANGAPADRTTVFRYGNLIAPEHFRDPASRPRLAHELKVSRPYLVCVGRLEPVKHPEDVLEALALLASDASCPEVDAVFVGHGRMMPELVRRAAGLGLEGRVLFPGNLDQPTIASALSEAAVVLAPMTGRALVEAALSLTPIVAYDVEWHPEIVEDHVTGRLVPYRDVAAMASATSQLLQDQEFADGLARNARARALEMMDPERLAENERNAYRFVLGERRSM